MQNTIFEILNDMSEILDIKQMRKLQESLIKHLQATEKEYSKEIDNIDYLNMFVAAKRIEGCSERAFVSACHPWILLSDNSSFQKTDGQKHP